MPKVYTDAEDRLFLFCFKKYNIWGLQARNNRWIQTLEDIKQFPDIVKDRSDLGIKNRIKYLYKNNKSYIPSWYRPGVNDTSASASLSVSDSTNDSRASTSSSSSSSTSTSLVTAQVQVQAPVQAQAHVIEITDTDTTTSTSSSSAQETPKKKTSKIKLKLKRKIKELEQLLEQEKQKVRKLEESIELDKPAECPICLDNIEYGYVLDCKHGLCTDCYFKMMAKSMNSSLGVKCPCCRTSVKIYDARGNLRDLQKTKQFPTIRDIKNMTM